MQNQTKPLWMGSTCSEWTYWKVRGDQRVFTLQEIYFTARHSCLWVKALWFIGCSFLFGGWRWRTQMACLSHFGLMSTVWLMLKAGSLILPFLWFCIQSLEFCQTVSRGATLRLINHHSRAFKQGPVISLVSRCSPWSFLYIRKHLS